MSEAELRELDARVHREIMVKPTLFFSAIGPEVTWYESPSPGVCLPIPAYSSDIAAAWLVVEKMREKEKIDGKEIDFDMVRNWGMDNWFVSFVNGSGANGTTAPLAICMAALTATGAGKGEG